MDTHGCYDHKTMQFTVPVSGKYMVRGQAIKAIPTGEFETVRNPRRKWWTPWRDKTITQEIYKIAVVAEGTEVRYYNAGDTIKTDLAVRLREGPA